MAGPGADRRVAAASGAQPRQARSERTRRRLLEAALELLAAHGPGAVTHRAIADRADVSLGATTYHFPSKYDLLGEVYRLHLSRVRDRAQGLFEAFGSEAGRAPGSPRERLAAGVLRYLEQGVRRERLGSLASFELALERARDPALRGRLRRAQSESNAHAVELLRGLGLPAPETAAGVLIAALDGLRLAWLAEGERSGFGRRVPELVERLCDALWLPERGRGAAGLTGSAAAARRRP